MFRLEPMHLHEVHRMLCELADFVGELLQEVRDVWNLADGRSSPAVGISVVELAASVPIVDPRMLIHHRAVQFACFFFGEERRFLFIVCVNSLASFCGLLFSGDSRRTLTIRHSGPANSE